MRQLDRGVRSLSRLDSIEDFRDDLQMDALVGAEKMAQDRLYPDRFSYNIVPAASSHHHQHQHSSPASFMLSKSHSNQSLTSEDYGLLQRLSSTTLTSPPSSQLPSGISSPYLRTALNSYTSEEDLKALFGGQSANLPLNQQRLS
jgi:hypothetical protein